MLRAAAIMIVLLALPCRAAAYNQHQVFFQNTDYELHVYRIYGEEPGKTMLIIGGMQGNEPGGYLAADLYVEMALKRGNLIVVPRANFCSILRNVRGVNGDMNRKFEKVDENDRDRQIIEKLKELIHESDYMLNLHDGSGFFSPTWASEQRNPQRYGQSIIADCETFISKRHNAVFNLGEIAQRICSRVNDEIREKGNHFHFNNHRTSAPDTPHAEQRKSATYFAVKQLEIPAFGIETSKEIPSAQQRVRYQTMVINTFMDEFGIIPDNPSVALPDPQMKYLIVAVNDSPPIVVYNGDRISVARGDAVTIIHAEVNYERGITANIMNAGSINDLRHRLIINDETDIIVQKDNLKCGQVSIAFKQPSPAEPAAVAAAAPAAGQVSCEARVKYLIMQVNADKVALAPGEHRRVTRGDVLVLKDLITMPPDDRGLKVNFKGYVGNKFYNDGEDRGCTINTDTDLISRFSRSLKGETYEIQVSDRTGKPVAEFFVEIGARRVAGK
jgi:hypothetical protein